jgi:diacylglycerol O-acyltransferase / wax synthase
LLGSKDNRVVNDVASVTKLVLSDSPDTVWSGELGVSKTIAWSTPISLAEVKAISQSQGATVNDVLLAAMAGGVRRYLELHDAPVRELQWLVPVNLKPFADNLPAELGNYFALVMLPMPLDGPDARDRIRQMKAQMERIKNSDEAVITFTLQRFMSMSPSQVQFHLTNFFANKTVGVLTNVPGPQGLLRFGGSPVVQIIGFAPCSGSNPMAATIFSYNGTVTIGFATDTGLVPDPEVLVEFVMQEAAAMQSLVPAARRGAPKAVAAGTPKPPTGRRRPTPKVN